MPPFAPSSKRPAGECGLACVGKLSKSCQIFTSFTAPMTKSHPKASSILCARELPAPRWRIPSRGAFRCEPDAARH
eukprot:9284343-Pyramimonas_sp.AAC.1